MVDRRGRGRRAIDSTPSSVLGSSTSVSVGTSIRPATAPSKRRRSCLLLQRPVVWHSPLGALGTCLGGALLPFWRKQIRQ
jgi:hypothetical protein